MAAGNPSQPQGIGGWLILAIFGFLCTIAGAVLGFLGITSHFYLLFATVGLNVFMKLGVFDQLILVLYVLLASWMLVIIFTGTTSLYKISRSARQAPWWAIFHCTLLILGMLGGLAATLYSAVFGMPLSDEAFQIMLGELLAGTFTAGCALLGIAYFRASRRVRNTFIF